ncbi:MAG: phosphomannomutase/phosphoglucomutase [Alphaproteobacteria bacterium]|nr:phosphomannomutase/phosphoglucomutase [Alphaproteobacteria bacterium]
MALPVSADTAPLTHYFDPSILREYDIRGLVDQTLSEADAYAIGRGFGTLLRRDGGTRASVGYDGRLSSPFYARAVARGFMDCGLSVDFIGMGPSPMLYFAVKDRQTDGGVMVTGSHNPPTYNGFKMMRRTGSVYGDMIQEIGRIAAAGNYETGQGVLNEIDIRDAYTARLIKDYDGGRPLKIVWDNGNGAAGDILKRLVAQLPGEHILLYADIDGNFPNHHPDPTVDKNLADLRSAVLTHHADLGIAFDGDGDRIGAVNEKAGILRCDSLMTLYARDVLENHPGASIIGDVKCSQMMFEEIARLGGKPIMWKTGHSLVKAKMAEEKSPLAGELSGHIFFADRYYGYDDALYCAVRLMNIIGGQDQALSALTAHLPTLFSTPELRVDVDEATKFETVRTIAANLKNSAPAGTDINETDGVRITTPEGWYLIRASNTQNVLVCRAESGSEAGLKKLLDHLAKEVAKTGYTLTVET